MVNLQLLKSRLDAFKKMQHLDFQYKITDDNYLHVKAFIYRDIDNYLNISVKLDNFSALHHLVFLLDNV